MNKQPEQIALATILASDVQDPFGRVLIKAGQHLDERHRKVLKAWGISSVDVEATDNGQPLHSEPAIPEDLRTLLDARFGLTNRHHPAIEALYHLCLKRTAGDRLTRDPP